ncbi:MAG: cytochrome c-type biogenesis protein CcmH [Anaerolineales bacterium]|nr:cytochrome c-type biogenesis protein CcmH [Anaerolineales bacterium]
MSHGSLARQWRELIRTQLGEGMTEQQITRIISLLITARVLSEPPRMRIELKLYIVPCHQISLGAFFLFRSFREDKGFSNSSHYQRGKKRSIIPCKR